MGGHLRYGDAGRVSYVPVPGCELPVQQPIWIMFLLGVGSTIAMVSAFKPVCDPCKFIASWKVGGVRVYMVYQVVSKVTAVVSTAAAFLAMGDFDSLWARYQCFGVFWATGLLLPTTFVVFLSGRSLRRMFWTFVNFQEPIVKSVALVALGENPDGMLEEPTCGRQCGPQGEPKKELVALCQNAEVHDLHDELGSDLSGVCHLILQREHYICSEVIKSLVEWRPCLAYSPALDSLHKLEEVQVASKQPDRVSAPSCARHLLHTLICQREDRGKAPACQVFVDEFMEWRKSMCDIETWPRFWGAFFVNLAYDKFQLAEVTGSVNSGAMGVKVKLQFVSKVLTPLCAVSLLPLAPFVVTHLLPALFIFFPVTLLLLLFIFFVWCVLEYNRCATGAGQQSITKTIIAEVEVAALLGVGVTAGVKVLMAAMVYFYSGASWSTALSDAAFERTSHSYIMNAYSTLMTRYDAFAQLVVQIL